VRGDRQPGPRGGVRRPGGPLIPLRALQGIARAELLSLLRTPELYLYGLVPAALYVPVLAVFVSLAVTPNTPRVLVPAEPLPGEKWPDTVRVEARADPGAAYEAGAGDAVVDRWEEGDGPLLRVAARSRDPRAAEAIRSSARAAASKRLDARIREVGADPKAVRWFAEVRQPPAVRPAFPFAGAFGLIAPGLMLVAVQLAMFQVPARITPDRTRGVVEALAATATSPALVLLVRVALLTAVVLLMVALPVGSAALLLGSVEILPGPGAALEGASYLFLVCLAMTVAAFAAPSLRAAYARAGYVALPLGALPLQSSLWATPPWAPGLGFQASEGAGARAVGTLLLVALLGWILHRMCRSELALPVGEGDE
jgi:hypothetical protein